MPFAIDEEALRGDPDKGVSGLQQLDMNNPPKKQIPHQPFPKMVYLHPKDKTKAHRTKIVQDSDELDAAKEVGWQEKPHIPIEKPEDLSKEFDTGEPVKRGPGRPPNAA